MRIALARNGDQLADHFGRCEGYEIVDIADSEVIERQSVPNPGHEPGVLPKMLSEMEASCVIAGGMGPRAQALFAESGIETITGVSGSLNEIIEAFAWGRLTADGGNPCHHVGE